MRPLLPLLAALLLAAGAAGGPPLDRIDTLTVSLSVLAHGYDPEAANEAGRILQDSELSEEDHAVLLRRALSRQPLTPPLARYLSDLGVQASAATTRSRLQEALSERFVAEIEGGFRGLLPDRLVATGRSGREQQQLRAALQNLSRIAYHGDQLSPASRRSHYRRLRAVIASQPALLRKNFTIDVEEHLSLAALRAQLYKNLRDLPRPFRAEAFIEDTGFWGPYSDLVRNHGVLVLDNNGLDAGQLRAIQELLALIPPSLHSTTHISVHDLLGNRVGEEVQIAIEGSPGVNIFALSLTTHLGNDFPPDAEAVPVRSFCSVLQHELNHMVDAHSVSSKPARAKRRDALIAQAGDEPKQYLRSMFEPGFFVAHPQEFFASIASEYFSDSFETLVLALERFENGWPEPLNQFLFFAEVLSRGGDGTVFATQGTACDYSLHPVPVARDEDGRIDRISLPGIELRWELDAAGNVVR